MMEEMQRIRPILQDREFLALLKEIEYLERDRIYCRHGLPHLLDTARIAAILAADRKADCPRDVIYAAALLHDIGRAAQYQQNVPHAQAGAEIAARILQRTEFTQDEQAEILTAIGGHQSDAAENSLTQLIHEADHRCRMCFACAAQDTCKWTMEERNRTVWL